MDIDETELIDLTSIVIKLMKLNSKENGITSDCWQTAYVAGLTALRNAENKNKRPSRPILIKCMRTAVYRFLHRKSVPTYETPPEAQDSHDYFTAIDAKDFSDAYQNLLTNQQQRTLKAFYDGYSHKEIAQREEITPNAVHARIKTSLNILRESAEITED